MKALLDGLFVDDKTIDASKHIFIGMFRRPFAHFAYSYHHCSCGAILQTWNASREHWQWGYYDIPIYRSLSKEAPASDMLVAASCWLITSCGLTTEIFDDDTATPLTMDIVDEIDDLIFKKGNNAHEMPDTDYA